MNTQTHLLISAFLLTKPGQSGRNIAAIVGALVPDASIYALVIWSKINQIPESQVWNGYYWQQPWQLYGAISNSIPLYLFGLLLSLVFLNHSKTEQAVASANEASSKNNKIWLWACVFFASCLLHIAFDFPVHVDDAHRHFWPLSDWRFQSSISYWNSAHHGDLVQIIEFLAAMVMLGVLFRRFKALWVRSLLVIAGLAYLIMPFYWAWQFS